MNCESVSTHDKGVVCIFRSTRTPLPVPSLNHTPANGSMSEFARLSLVRCQSCGKEAQYQAIEIIPLRLTASCAASA